MAAEQYGNSTNNYQVVWNGSEWIITSDAEWSASDTITIASEINAGSGSFVVSTSIYYRTLLQGGL